jgi:hypothetical protein
MTFTLWTETYRICFSYSRNAGQRIDTYAWLERKTRYGWVHAFKGYVGHAYVQFKAPYAFLTEQGRAIAALPDNLPPALRRSMVDAIRAHYSNPQFNAEKGRKLALARCLQGIMCRSDRRVVWEAYLNRPRTSGLKPVLQTDEVLSQHIKEEQEMWDAFDAAQTYRYSEEWDSFVIEGGVQR